MKKLNKPYQPTQLYNGIKTEAEARGKMYLWLLKEGYINGKA